MSFEITLRHTEKLPAGKKPKIRKLQNNTT